MQPHEAGVKIANLILGPKSKNKYLPQLTQHFSKFSKNFQKINLSAHLKKICPLPSNFKTDFAKNLSEDYSFEYLFSSHCK